MIKNSILLGAPGSGKGTAASIISSLYNVEHVSTGDIFRSHIKNQTPLGLKISSILASGAYVSDKLTNEIVKKQIDKLTSGNLTFFLDGYPRTLNQAHFLADLIPVKKNFAILLDVEPEKIIARISGRRSCPICQKIFHLESNPSKNRNYCDGDHKKTALIFRLDDQPATVQKRLEIYFEQTMPLIDFYKSKNALITIDGLQDPKLVVLEILIKAFGISEKEAKEKLGL